MTIQRLVESIEQQGRAGFLRVTLLLLGLDRSTMKWLAADLEHSIADSVVTGNRHQSQLSSPDARTVLTIFTARSWSRADIGEKLAEVRFRKYDAHADRSVSIFIVPGTDRPSVVEYDIDDAKWEQDDALEADVRTRKTSFIRQFVRTKGEPKPNVKCPCGRGKKFKSCCRGLLS